MKCRTAFLFIITVALLALPALGVNTATYLHVHATNSTGGHVAVGDYSNVSQTFSIAPPAGETWYVHRMLAYLRDTGAFDAEDYGNGVTLTNGITIRTNISGTVNNITEAVPIKSNADWAHWNYDASVFTWGTGDEFLSARWTFAKAGTVFKLDGDAGDSIDIILNDDFSGLNDHHFMFQGYIGPSTESNLLTLPLIVMMSTLLVLLTVGIFISKTGMTKVLLALPLNLVLILLITFTRLGIEAARPDLTDIITLLNVMYYSSVVFFFPLLVVCFWLTMKTVTLWLLNPRLRRDRDWDE